MMDVLIQAVMFVLVVSLAFGMGQFVLGECRSRFRWHELLVVGISLGMVVWTLSLYFAWILGVRAVVTPLYLGISLWSWWHNLKDWKVFLSIKGNILTVGLIVAGVIAQLFLVAPSGLVYEDGLRTYGVNTHDGVWHVALMMTLGGDYPPEMPTFSGTILSGYHYMVDLFGSELVGFFGLSAFSLVFRLLPVLFSVLMGLGVYSVLWRVTQSRLAVWVGVYLTYFGGSLGYVLSWWGNDRWSESSFWAQQSITTLVNLPLAASLVIMLAISIILLRSNGKKKDRRLLYTAALLAGSLIAFKAHTGIVVMAGFGVWALLYYLKKKQIGILIPAGLGSLLFILFLVSQISDSTGLLFEPGWFLKTMMEASDRVGWVQWELWRQSLVRNEQWLKVGILWLLAAVLFIVGNMGVRIVGLSAFLDKKLYQKHKVWLWFWLVIAVLGFILPLFFIQKGIVWNTIQFFYVTLFVMNILTALVIGRVKGRVIQTVLVIGIVSMNLPTTIKTLIDYATMYAQGNSVRVVSNEELGVLNFLVNQPDGTILAMYDETAIITALTGKSVFFADETQAVLLGLDFEERKSLLTSVMCFPMNGDEVHSLLKKYQIKYIYLPPDNLNCNSHYLADMSFLQQIYNNNNFAEWEQNTGI
jgi:hypothetical protein